MAGTATALMPDKGELGVYFALGFCAALALVGLAMTLKAFGLWRLKHARINDRIRFARVTGAAVIAETVTIAQAANITFLGIRRAGHAEFGWFFDRLLPAGSGSIITAALGFIALASFALLRGEFIRAAGELGVLLRNRAGAKI